MTMIRTIVAATDFSPGSHAVVERAVQLAEEQIRLLHDSMYTKALRQLEQLAQELTREADHQVGAEVVGDVAAQAIVEHAAALPADCMAVGRHGEGTVAERVLGNMAQHVLHHTLRDVLVAL